LEHAVLRNALAHAEREELISRNVAKLVRIASPRYKIGKGLSVDEVRRLLAAASVYFGSGAVSVATRGIEAALSRVVSFPALFAPRFVHVGGKFLSRSVRIVGSAYCTGMM
jgi:hypothetical protein